MSANCNLSDYCHKSVRKPDALNSDRLSRIEWSEAFEVGRFIYGSVKRYYYVGISRLRVLWTDLLSAGLIHPHDNIAVYVFIICAWIRTVVRVKRCSHLGVQRTYFSRYLDSMVRTCSPRTLRRGI